MDEKDTLLNSIRAGLAEGTITADDVRALVLSEDTSGVFQDQQTTPAPNPVPAQATGTLSDLSRQESGRRLSLVDVLFYLAGGILYASLMVMAFQAGSDSPGARISLMLVSGLCLWTLTFVLGRSGGHSENRDGFINAMLLTGCLAVISGGVMAAAEVSQSAEDQFGYALASALLLLGGFHLFFDRLFRHTVLVVFGMFLVVSSFPSFIGALIQGQDLPLDVWTLIGMGTGVLTAVAGRIASRTAPGRESLLDSFLSVAGFLVLGSVYGASIGSEAAGLWSIVLPLLIYAAFYLSIKRRSKNFLVTGSVFLVLFVITVAFKYFSGFGAAFSLLLSATALLGTAFMASNINNRYIKADH